MAGMLGLIMLAAQSAQAQTLNILHNFTDGGDGANPEGRLTIDRGGHLYGTTYSGGIQYDGGFGVVFRMSPVGSGWTFAPIFTFNFSSEGIDPAAGVLFGPNGLLYGTTSNGGTVFTLQPSPTVPPTVLSPWVINWLYNFPLNADAPTGDVVFDAAGNIYGATWTGGSNGCFDNRGCGTVYELTPSAGGWLETTLYIFQGGADGTYPTGVTFDSAGNLIGTATYGGAYDEGVIFQLTRSGDSWTESVLYNFDPRGNGGYAPDAGLISDASGNLYGSTLLTPSPTYSGTIFEFSPSNGGWVYSVLAQIPPQYEYGPTAPLTMDAAGNLYGTIASSGTNGAVFKLTPGNGGWTFTSLHDFTGPPDGSDPDSTVAIGADGNLYGTTFHGGNCGGLGCGTVWEIAP
jgi:uncharacterized repeat protein (TIGR03803 family)